MQRSKMLIISMFLILSFCLFQPRAHSFIIIDWFADAFRNILSGASKYITQMTFTIAGKPIVAEDNTGNIINYGEFGPEKMYDKKGNLLREWVYIDGKLAYTIDYTDDGEIYIIYDEGKIVRQEWKGDEGIYGEVDFSEFGLTKGTYGYIIAEYTYGEDGILDYVTNYVVTTEAIDEGEATDDEENIITIENEDYEYKYKIEIKTQITYYNDVGRIDHVENSEGATIKKYVYDANGILQCVKVYEYDEETQELIATNTIHYIGGKPDHVTNENDEVIAQVYYDGAKIDYISGTGEGIRALGYDVNSELASQADLTLHFNDMGLPIRIENSESAGKQIWLYSWELEGASAEKICEMFGWDPDNEDALAVAQTILNALTEASADGHAPRLVAVLNLSTAEGAGISQSDFEEFYNVITGDYSDEWDDFISALEDELGRSLTDDEIEELVLDLYTAIITGELDVGDEITLTVDDVEVTFSVGHSPDASASGSDDDDVAIFVTLGDTHLN